MSAGNGDPPDEQTLRGLLDYFTDIDDKIDTLDDTVSDLASVAGAIPQALDQQRAGLERLADELNADDNIFNRREGVFPMSSEVPADTSRIGDNYVVEYEVPYDAVLTRVIVESNESAQGGLGFQLTRADGADRFIPEGGEGRTVGTDPEEPKMLSIPTSPVEFNPGIRFNEGSEVRAQYQNNDPNDSHYATVITVLEPVEVSV